jgi:hypothetical protein
MPELAAAATLDLWQAVETLPPVDRTLALAAAVDPDAASPEALAELPLGQRDTRLLELHERLVGRLLEATATCPGCGSEAEFSVDADALLGRAAHSPAPRPLEFGSWVVEWRSPDSQDVEAAARAGDAPSAERVLLERCVAVTRGPGGELPADVREAVTQAMLEADPLAEVLVDIVCPDCEVAFVADVDLGSFVWAELRVRALGLLHDVAALARAYGWSEVEVLALSARRREAYLELSEART